MIGERPGPNQRETPVIEDWAPGAIGGGREPLASSKNTGVFARSDSELACVSLDEPSE